MDGFEKRVLITFLTVAILILPCLTTDASSAKEITAFSFLASDNVALAVDVVATIDGTSITATVPSGTDRTALVAGFSTTGVSVRVGATPQVSGVTANDFSTAVTYTVEAEDGSTQDYTVTVTDASSAAFQTVAILVLPCLTTDASSAKEITAFSFLASDNVALAVDVVATIDGTSITATVPSGTDRTALVAGFSTTGVSVRVEATPQVSGVTANDFSTAVTYTVEAEDGSTQDYTVTVTGASSAKEITAFSFLASDNVALAVDVVATIDGTSITATVPSGTDRTALVAGFSTTGVSVRVGATPQVSGVTPNDFSTAVTYTVEAEDGSTQDYTVTVTGASSAKEITAFSFLASDNVALAVDVVATIDGTSITATVPSGTDRTALVAGFSTTGVSVRVGATPQVSGVTPNDFSTAVTYTVEAEDGSTQDYTVTVTGASSAKEITAFSFLASDNVALAVDVVATIDGTSITATVPSGTDRTALVAGFSTTGVSVRVGATPQVSGVTANDFSTAVTYTVEAEDGSTQDYTVTVTDASSAKEITAFSFLASDNVALAVDVVATIDGTSITATVPSGTDRTALVAGFSTTGVSVRVGKTPQVSGVTANDFSTAVTYTVEAEDGSTQDYTVTVTDASSAKEITAFSFLASDNVALAVDVVATIDGTSITATVPSGTARTALVASFSTTGVSVRVGKTPQVSGVTAA